MRVLIVTHCLAAFAGLANGLPWAYKLIVFVAVSCSLFLYLRRYHYQFQPCQIKHNQASTWLVAVGCEAFQTMQIESSSVVTTWLIVLHFRMENGKRYNLLIPNDALSDKDYRALVVQLKIS